MYNLINVISNMKCRYLDASLYWHDFRFIQHASPICITIQYILVKMKIQALKLDFHKQNLN